MQIDLVFDNTNYWLSLALAECKQIISLRLLYSESREIFLSIPFAILLTFRIVASGLFWQVLCLCLVMNFGYRYLNTLSFEYFNTHTVAEYLNIANFTEVVKCQFDITTK